MPYNRAKVASFSSGASLVFPDKDENALVTKPDVVAPGAQVYSCIPPEKRPDGTYEYTYMDGTSMATPHVAGIAALLMAAKPAAPVEDIISALKDTAKHPTNGQSRPDNRWGYGLVQPVEAKILSLTAYVNRCLLVNALSRRAGVFRERLLCLLFDLRK